jgi:hypothetical protein
VLFFLSVGGRGYVDCTWTLLRFSVCPTVRTIAIQQRFTAKSVVAQVGSTEYGATEE